MTKVWRNRQLVVAAYLRALSYAVDTNGRLWLIYAA
jgi:hypothetical protein